MMKNEQAGRVAGAALNPRRAKVALLVSVLAATSAGFSIASVALASTLSKMPSLELGERTIIVLIFMLSSLPANVLSFDCVMLRLVSQHLFIFCSWQACRPAFVHIFYR
ncbi:hypothetical protein V6N11_052255 [Hibiscus sabdariffa]|uniref:Uncharacterized protein n=1 Tax=Hibiscus sabdariffa TaxID=183260 RepID=A0ABR2U9H2_9ROSI